MRNVQIRNVPDRVHRVLVRRAKEAGQSLQEYLLGLLAETTSKPTVGEVLARAGRRSGAAIEPGEVAEAIRAEREERDRRWS